MMCGVYSIVLSSKIHATFRGGAELERGLAALIGDEEVGLSDDVHANEQVVVVEVGAIDLMLGEKFTI